MTSAPQQLRLDGTPEPAPEPKRAEPFDFDQWNNQERLRWVLSDGRWHSWRELMRVAGARFGGRLFELRNQGLDIQKEFRGHVAWYRWAAPAGAVQP